MNADVLFEIRLASRKSDQWSPAGGHCVKKRWQTATGREDVILGFDPGGVKQFGWCVAQATDDGRLQLCASGVASHAAGAVTAALGKAEDFGRIGAAAIDSPRFWVADGDRKADKTIRSAMKRL